MDGEVFKSCVAPPDVHGGINIPNIPTMLVPSVFTALFGRNIIWISLCYGYENMISCDDCSLLWNDAVW